MHVVLLGEILGRDALDSMSDTPRERGYPFFFNSLLTIPNYSNSHPLIFVLVIGYGYANIYDIVWEF